MCIRFSSLVFISLGYLVAIKLSTVCHSVLYNRQVMVMLEQPTFSSIYIKILLKLFQQSIVKQPVFYSHTTPIILFSEVYSWLQTLIHDDGKSRTVYYFKLLFFPPSSPTFESSHCFAWTLVLPHITWA